MNRQLLKWGLLAMVIGMTGCGGAGNEVKSATSETVVASGENETMRIDSEECLERASRAMGLIRAQKWNDLREMSSSKIKKVLTNDVLIEVWKKFISPAGPYVEKVSDLVIIKDGNQVVELVTRFKNQVVVATFSFDTKGKLNGFYFIEQVNSEDWPVCYRDCAYASERFIGAFRGKDWKYLHKVMSDDMNAKLTDDALETVNSQLFSMLGKYVSFEERNSKKVDGITEVVEIENYEHGQLRTTLSFDSNGKAVGFYVKPQIDGGTSQEIDTPAADANFVAEKVTVAATPETPLDGILTLPKSGKKFPVVILVHGSGPHDMNETIGPNKPFKDIADGLAERGIATLRYDKRSLAHPGSIQTIEDEYITDVRAAIRMMQKDERVGKIFVLGHSQGGSLIPAISVAHPELAGVISMSGTLREIYESVPEQLALQLELARSMMNDTDYSNAEAEVKSALAEMEKIKTLPAELNDDEVLFYAPVRYWRSLHQVMSNDDVSKMTHPFFIAQGMDDVQVYYDRDYKIWEEKACNRSGVTCKAYPGLNHLLMSSQGKKYGEEYQLPSKVSGEFIEDLAKFVLSN